MVKRFTDYLLGLFEYLATIAVCISAVVGIFTVITLCGTCAGKFVCGREGGILVCREIKLKGGFE